MHKTKSGRRITPRIKLGRPPGAISTAQTKFKNLIEIMVGDDAPRVIKSLKKRGHGMMLNQFVDVGTTWAKRKGCILRVPKPRIFHARQYTKALRTGL